ncbi:MAG: TniQ family protein [Xanthomonadaceae bacterium]|nr:TniQ family protein [Xanthomonadaceae bacterium]
MVESIDHFLMRLSWTTGLTVTAILRLGDGSQLDEYRCHSRAGYSYACVPDYLADIETLVGGGGLRQGTLWRLREVLSARPFGRVRNRRRWCPACYLEWDDDYSAEALVFAIELCKTCPEHGCALESHCPHCSASQPTGTRLDKRRMCVRCGGTLGHLGNRVKLSNIDEWANKQAVQLVELCASEGMNEVAENCFQSYMAELTDVSHQRDASPALQEQIGILSRIKRPTIRQLINAAALQGVSVRDILLTPREAAAQPLLDQWAERTILPLDMGRHDDVVREVARLCTCLWRSRGKVLMPSLRFILKDFGIHRSFFKEFRPDFYTRSIDLFEGQLEGSDQDLYRKIFPRVLPRFHGRLG